MKLAFQGSLGYGGLGTVTRELTRHLAGHLDVTVFDVFRSYLGGLSPLEVGRIGISSPPFWAKLPVNLPFQAMAFRKHDMVHVNYAAYGMPAIFSNKFAKLPFIETVHGIPQPGFEDGYDKLGYIAESWALPLTSGKASSVLADSDYIREELRRRYSIRSRTLRLGVDTVRFTPPTESEAAVARKRLRIPEADQVVLYVGRLHPWKDPLTLVRAASLVLSKRKNVDFYFVGRGRLYDEINTSCTLLGIQDRVFVATDPEYYHGLTDYYNAADIFVLPTINEGFGLVVLEAMASGLPVIASDGGAPPELLGDTGVLFRTGDHDSLATAMLKLLSDVGLRHGLGAAARARAVAVFSWEKCADAYLRLYGEVLGTN